MVTLAHAAKPSDQSNAARVAAPAHGHLDTCPQLTVVFVDSAGLCVGLLVNRIEPAHELLVSDLERFAASEWASMTAAPVPPEV